MWPPRITMAEMTPADAAKFLRGLCELTAAQSRDWDSMQEIFEQILTDAYNGGKAAAERAAAEPKESP